MRRFSLFCGWAAVFGSAGVLGCGALDANAPNTLQRDDLNNPVGAQLVISGVRSSVSKAFGLALQTSGALTDEWTERAYTSESLSLQQRDSVGYVNGFLQQSGQNDNYTVITYYRWQTAYRDASIALTLLRIAAPANIRNALIGEVFALRGFVLVSLAEQICPGFPIADVDVSSDGTIVTPRFTSNPQTADSAFTRALADFDSATVYARDSTRIITLARIGSARAHLGLGHFGAASTIAAQVSTEFTYAFVRSDFSFRSEFAGYYEGSGSSGFKMYDREGTNGLDFVSANDPRVPATPYEDAHLFAPYIAFDPPIVLASGTEARLIQAEAQLATNPADAAWLTTLNALRRTVPPLSDTTDPGTANGRVNLVFRERAFWLFGTAHRLGDFRRLMKHYGRNAATVFPIGMDHFNRPYGTLTSIPFDGTSERALNPKIRGCLAESTS